jgi:hypothetical protein
MRPPESCVVFVGNLPPSYDEEALEASMQEFGSVKSSVVRREPVSGESLRYGFCEFFSQKDAQAAANEMQDKEIQGYTVMANLHHGTSRPDLARSLTKTFQTSGFGSSTKMDASSKRDARSALSTAVNASSWLRVQYVPLNMSKQQLMAISGKHGNVLDVCISAASDGRRHAYLQFATALDAHCAFESAQQSEKGSDRTALDVELKCATIEGVAPAFLVLLNQGHPRQKQIEDELVGMHLYYRAFTSHLSRVSGV